MNCLQKCGVRGDRRVFSLLANALFLKLSLLQTKREELIQKPAEDASKQGKSEQKHPKRKNKQHISQKPLSLYTHRGYV